MPQSASGFEIQKFKPGGKEENSCLSYGGGHLPSVSWRETAGDDLHVYYCPAESIDGRVYSPDFGDSSGTPYH